MTKEKAPTCAALWRKFQLDAFQVMITDTFKAERWLISHHDVMNIIKKFQDHAYFWLCEELKFHDREFWPDYLCHKENQFGERMVEFDFLNSYDAHRQVQEKALMYQRQTFKWLYKKIKEKRLGK